jgi:excisionase family DNA binding protein
MDELKIETSQEIGVDEASILLGVSERTMLNYIKLKQIKAVKVGKRWFIDRISCEKFGKGKTKVVILTEKNTKEKENEIPQTSPSAKETTEHSPTSYSSLGNKQERKTIKSLACYRLALTAFKMPMWQISNSNPYSTQLTQFRYKILEHLGAGYCSFGAAKRHHYDQSRGVIGSVLAIIYSDEKLATLFEKDLSFLENELLLAFTSLIRKIEKCNRREFVPREKYDY